MENLELKNNFWKNKKVFVTGHTGFKGSWLCTYLIFLGADVTGYSLASEKNSLFKKLNLSKKMNSIIGNVKNKNKLFKSIRNSKADIVFHLAAQPLVSEGYSNSEETFNTNIFGTINLLENIKKLKFIKSIVIITTDKCYHNIEKKNGYKEDDKLGGYDPYSASKSAVEIICSSYRDSFFNNKSITNIATARSGNVIGGGDWSKNRIIPDLISSIFFKKKLLIRNPKSIRPWQHVLEPCLGYLMLAEKLYLNKKNFDSAWNFGPNMNQSKDVVWIVKESIKILKMKKEFKISKKSIFHETNQLRLNSSKSKKYLMWKPKLKLKLSLKLALEWYKKSINSKNMWEYTINQIEYYNNIR